TCRRRCWGKRDELDRGKRDGVRTAERERIKALEREVEELRRTDETATCRCLMCNVS
ncbi:hypothetical protein GSH04_30465, partial [Burkholderia pseudomallei]|nr:hypothetical protein [Burkholderia pseudomallei]